MKGIGRLFDRSELDDWLAARRDRLPLAWVAAGLAAVGLALVCAALLALSRQPLLRVTGALAVAAAYLYNAFSCLRIISHARTRVADAVRLAESFTEEALRQNRQASELLRSFQEMTQETSESHSQIRQEVERQITELAAAQEEIERLGRQILHLPKVGTLERVRMAHRYAKRGMGLVAACKKAHVDTRTYYQRCREATGEDPVIPYFD